MLHFLILDHICCIIVPKWHIEHHASNCLRPHHSNRKVTSRNLSLDLLLRNPNLVYMGEQRIEAVKNLTLMSLVTRFSFHHGIEQKLGLK
jgi:hypothetical protein